MRSDEVREMGILGRGIWDDLKGVVFF